MTTSASGLANWYKERISQPGTGIVEDYYMTRQKTGEFCQVKLVPWRNKKELVCFIIPPDSLLTANEVKKLYRKRFIIETYYHMMHRFQPFSCSQHPVIRYILVCLAFWMCNLWNYFKYPLTILKPTSKKVRADKTYTANTFCESILESWHISIHRGRTG
jgi:hypothetical protein